MKHYHWIYRASYTSSCGIEGCPCRGRGHHTEHSAPFGAGWTAPDARTAEGYVWADLLPTSRPVTPAELASVRIHVTRGNAAKKPVYRYVATFTMAGNVHDSRVCYVTAETRADAEAQLPQQARNVRIDLRD